MAVSDGVPTPTEVGVRRRGRSGKSATKIWIEIFNRTVGGSTYR